MTKSQFERSHRQLSLTDLQAPEPAIEIKRPDRTRQKIKGVVVEPVAAELIKNAEKTKGVAVNLAERRQSLLTILTALGSVSSRTALDSVMHKESLAATKKEITKKYEPGEMENIIAPAAKYNRRFFVRDVEKELDAVAGDVDAAYATAWSEFTPEERANLIVNNPELYPDREEISIAFRAEFGTKTGTGSRDDLRDQLAGKITRRRPMISRLPLPEDPGSHLAA